MTHIVIPDDAIERMYWDFLGSDFDLESQGVHDALFANLMGWS